MTKPNKKAVKAAIEGAAPAEPAGPSDQDLSWGQYHMQRTPPGPGLWWKPDPEKSPLFLAAPFQVLAATRAPDGSSWGLLLRWKDMDGLMHQAVLSRRAMSGEGAAVREILADGGLLLGATQPARQALMVYLNGLRVAPRVRTVNRPGWHKMPSGQVFVHALETIGAVGETVILDTLDAGGHVFQESGSLADWQREIAARCVGNDLLVFGVSLAFAPFLLELIGEDGTLFNLKGDSRAGKSTAQRVAASAVGGTPRAGAADYIFDWNATGNGVEALATGMNDHLLALQELGTADPKHLSSVIYMIAGGTGRQRMQRTGEARKSLRWRTMVLSSGELSLAAKLAEAGITMKAGLESRFVDVTADAGAGMGVFAKLHGEAGPGELAERLNELTRRFYGTASRAFLRRLVAQLNLDPVGFPDVLRARISETAKRLLQDVPDAGAQVRSVARRFALVAVAGELASEYQVTGWTRYEADGAVAVCFEAWLAQRGGSGSREGMQARNAVRECLERDGESRFTLWKTENQEGAEQLDHFRAGDRLGWRRPVHQMHGAIEFVFYFTGEGLARVLRDAGVDELGGKRTLVADGLLIAKINGSKVEGRPTKVPGYPKMRLLEVTPRVFDA
jgi:putative DNA primase/helicase